MTAVTSPQAELRWSDRTPSACSGRRSPKSRASRETRDGPGRSRGPEKASRTREIVTFAAVGGAGYVTDVAAFNRLRARPFLGGHDPIVAKVVAVAPATVVTYLGDRLLTWRDTTSDNRRREVLLFVFFNLAG